MRLLERHIPPGPFIGGLIPQNLIIGGSLVAGYLFDRTVADRTSSSVLTRVLHSVVRTLLPSQDSESNDSGTDVLGENRRIILIRKLCDRAVFVFEKRHRLWTLIEHSAKKTLCQRDPSLCLVNPDLNALAAAAYLGENDLFRQLFTQYGSNESILEEPTYFGTSLESAAASGNDRIISEYVLRSSSFAGLGHSDYLRHRLSRITALGGQTSTTQLLLPHGNPGPADVDSQKIKKLLDSALQGQNPDLFKQLFESLAVQYTWLREITDMALGRSAYYNRTDLAVWALDNGAKIDSLTRRPRTLPGDGRLRTALYWASSRGNDDTVSLLLSRGANQYWPSRHLRSSLIAAATRGYLSTVKLLIDQRFANKGDESSDYHFINREICSFDLLDETIFGKVVAHGHAHVVRYLIEVGVDLKRFSVAGELALNSAVKCGHLTIIKLLVEDGVDVNCTQHAGGSDPWSDIPIVVAEAYGRDDAVELLKTLGARNPVERSRNGKKMFRGSVLQEIFSPEEAIASMPIITEPTSRYS